MTRITVKRTIQAPVEKVFDNDQTRIVANVRADNPARWRSTRAGASARSASRSGTRACAAGTSTA